MKERCLVIPAIKKNAVIPDQLVKKLAGETLITRALNTARSVCPAEDIVVLTDSQEISLICERAGVRYVLNQTLRFRTQDIVGEMRELLVTLAKDYGNALILRASCPLVTWVDIEDAYKCALKAQADMLVTVKKVHQRLWNIHENNLESLLDEEDRTYVAESRALIIVRLASLLEELPKQRISPYFLDERAIEIQGYQDWWICERLLQRRNIVFVVAGFPAIGMGHVFRSLMLAHEISNHKIPIPLTPFSCMATP